ncbi:hypothetical protein [Massilia scottii]|uniref:hypothetical protein n=1 Tax=Massilia scottii TaxID=3057166 RepID=UPI0027966AB9|nr:hypothetical protein [Massilia sp. CCM 9029]MDQ1834941.1 hypothetical protein [Massilia sp. CCM 9029]
MIEFTADQEKKAMRRDCRVWTKLMAETWYASDYPHATDYPAVALVADLRDVYFACYNDDVKNTDSISLLGFIVLRANMLNCSNADIQSIVDYFFGHARGENVEYAQAWIEIYLEEIERYGT